jgi:hypothetical protein
MKKITPFWNYFQKNEQEILNAILLGINTDEIFSQLTKRLDYVSKRISFVIKEPLTIDNKFLTIFTGGGYRKLFPKIIAFEEQAPLLKHFTAQAFIKPVEEVEKYKNGTDEPCVCKNFEIKISEIQLALLDYNIATKHIKINLYLPDYNELKQYHDLKSNIDWIVMFIIGEIAYRKHIKEIRLHQIPLEPKGLLNLIELSDFIDYLSKINSRKKTRMK